MDRLNVMELNKKEIEDAKNHFGITLKSTFLNEGIVDMEELLSEEIHEKSQLLDMYLEDTTNSFIFLIAKIDEKIIGIASITPTGEIIKKCTNGRLDGISELGSLFVLYEYQGLGVGSRLIKHMMNELNSRGIKEFCLDSGYPTAQKIWLKKFGTPYIDLKDYWGTGKNHMIWYCNVDEYI